MPVKILRKSELVGTARHVRTHAYETYRFLLNADQAGVTLTDIVLSPGIEETYGYKDHIEVAYCLEGHAWLTDLATNAKSEIVPGTLWVASKGDTFSFIASVATRLICVFTPPFEGGETGFVAAPTNNGRPS
jgi:L-ectoine synthase